MKIINKFKNILSLEIKKSFFYLVVFSIVISILEILGLSLLMPFITLATNKEYLTESEVLNDIYTFMEFENYLSFVTFFGIGLLIFYIIRFIMLSLYSYKSLKFINYITHFVMTRLFKNYLYMEYSTFVLKNTAHLNKALLSETFNISNFVGAIIKIISESFILILFLMLLLYIDWKMTLSLIIVFIILFLGLIKILKSKSRQAGIKRERHFKALHTNTKETLANFLFTKLVGTEKKQIEYFEKDSQGLANVATTVNFLGTMPRYLLETIGIIVIVILILFVFYKYEDTSLILPIIGTYAIAFYRLLPSVNSILNSFTVFQFTKNAIDDIYEDFQIKHEEHYKSDIVEFGNKLELKNISFKFDRRDVFSNYSITIQKGEKIAFIGESGSGKSTLVNIIMGVLPPASGEVSVDGKTLLDNHLINWRKKFGFIPQNIYLFDGTVAENVAYGRNYCESKIIKALKQANIYDYFLEKEGINTKVGEGGIQISGGQKQRVAIARAIYDEPEILVLDEATSALDKETERLIMNEIYNLSHNKTLIIIAHRLNTLNRIDKIFFFNNK